MILCFLLDNMKYETSNYINGNGRDAINIQKYQTDVSVSEL